MFLNDAHAKPNLLRCPTSAEGWTHDTQLLSWVLSYDGKTVPDPLAVCGCAAALAVSNIPLVKPVAAVQLGMHPEVRNPRSDVRQAVSSL